MFQSLNHQPFAGHTPVYHVPVILQLLEINSGDDNKPNGQQRLPSGTEALTINFNFSKLGNNEHIYTRTTTTPQQQLLGYVCKYLGYMPCISCSQ